MSWLTNALGVDGRRERIRADRARQEALPGSRTNLVNEWVGTLDGDRQREAEAYNNYQGAMNGWWSATHNAENFDPTETRGYAPTETEGWAPTTLQGWNAANLGGFNADGLRNFDQSASTGALGGLQGFAPGFNPGAMGPSAAAAFNPRVAAMTGRLDAWDNSEFAAFDPHAYLRENADAIWSDTQGELQDQLEAVQNANARSGRLNSGWFDKDRGKTITNTMRGYQNAIGSLSLQAGGMRADVLGRAAEQRLTRANMADSLDTQASLESGRLGLQRAGMLDDYTIRRGGLALDASGQRLEALRAGADVAGRIDRNRLDALTSATGFDYDRAESMDRLGLERAGQIDQQTGERARFVDSERRARGEFIDRSRQDAGQFAAQQRGQQAQVTGQMFNDAANRRRDSIAGLIDQDTAWKNYQRERSADRWRNITGAFQTGGQVAALFT